MKKEQILFDFYHRKIGSIETDTATGDKIGFDFYHRVVGFYEAKTDVTKDFYHRVVGNGDLLSGLVMQANNE